MNADFVSFSLAKKLKEKGYPQRPDNMSCMPYYEYDEVSNYASLCNEIVWYRVDETRDNIFAAPAIHKVLKWLREEKNMYIEPCILVDCDTDADNNVINTYTYWSFSITSIESGDRIYYEYEHIDDKRFDSYEQSAIAGIEFCLNYLI